MFDRQDSNLPSMTLITKLINYIENDIIIILEGKSHLTDIIAAYKPNNETINIKNENLEKIKEFSIYIKFYLNSLVKKESDLHLLFKTSTDNDKISISLIWNNERRIYGVKVIVGNIIINPSFSEDDQFCIIDSWNDIVLVNGLEKEDDPEHKKLLWIFINGTWFPLRTSESTPLISLNETWILGNNDIFTQPFNGYLTTVAMFNKALNNADVYELHINEPFLYEDGLCSLLTVINNEYIDLVSCKKMENISHHIRYIYNTNISNIKPYRYRINKNSNYNEEIYKKAKLILTPILDLMSIKYGISSTPTLIENVIEYFGEEIISDKWFGNIINKLLEKNSIESDSVNDIISSLNNLDSIKYLKLFELLKFSSYFYLEDGDTLKERLPFITYSLNDFEENNGLFKSLLYEDYIQIYQICNDGISRDLYHVCEDYYKKTYNNSEKEPNLINDTQYETHNGNISVNSPIKEMNFISNEIKKKKKKLILILLELNFQVSPNDLDISGCHCQYYGGNITPPEWKGPAMAGGNSKQKISKPAIYISDKIIEGESDEVGKPPNKAIRLDAKIKLISYEEEDKSEHIIRIIGIGKKRIKNSKTEIQKNLLFDNIYGEVKIIADGNPVTVSLYAHKQVPILDEIYECGGYYEWYGTIDQEIESFYDRKVFIQQNRFMTIYHHIFAIPTVPCYPISLEKQRSYPFIELIHIGINPFISRFKWISLDQLKSPKYYWEENDELRNIMDLKNLTFKDTITETISPENLTNRLYTNPSFKYDSNYSPYYIPGEYVSIDKLNAELNEINNTLENLKNNDINDRDEINEWLMRKERFEMWKEVIEFYGTIDDISISKFYFFFSKFLKDYYPNCLKSIMNFFDRKIIKIECTIYAIILSYLFSLEDISSYIVKIKKDLIVKDSIYGAGGVKFKDALFEYHIIVKHKYFDYFYDSAVSIYKDRASEVGFGIHEYYEHIFEGDHEYSTETRNPFEKKIEISDKLILYEI